MTNLRWLVLVLVFCLTIQAQDADELAKEKERQKLALSSSIAGDIGQLVLAENRALSFAKLGRSLWESDQKRARGLFQDAVAELIAAQTAAEAARKNGQHNELLTGQQTRPQLLEAIATRDADLALQSLYKTRPAAIQRAMLTSAAKDRKIGNSTGNDIHLRQAEISLEQRFLRMAADQDPARAVELLKKALKTGLANETLELLKKLHAKEPNTANDLASDVVAQLARKTFLIEGQLDHQAFHAATSILTEFIREKGSADNGLRFDASQMRSLAEKLIGFYIEDGNRFGYGYSFQLVPIAEKLQPSAVEALKKSENRSLRWGGHHMIERDEKTLKLMNAETSIDEMLAQAPSLPVESRRQVYQSAASRLAADGQLDRARAVLRDNFSDDALESVNYSLEWNYVQHLTNQSRFSEAEAVINEFPDVNRYSALVSLATNVYNQDKKNKSYAVNLLEKARAQLGPKPETNMEMSYLTQIANAYSMIEPGEAFRIFETLVPQINELTEAAVITHGFQGSYNVRRGEILITQGGSIGLHLDISTFRNLAKTDFDRTLSLIGSFSRREMRVSLKQQLLEGL